MLTSLAAAARALTMEKPIWSSPARTAAELAAYLSLSTDPMLGDLKAIQLLKQAGARQIIIGYTDKHPDEPGVWEDRLISKDMISSDAAYLAPLTQIMATTNKPQRNLISDTDHTALVYIPTKHGLPTKVAEWRLIV